MNFCTVVCTLNPVDGGMVTWVNHLYRNLVRAGHSLEVVTLDRGSEPWYRDLPFPTVNLGLGSIGRFRYSRTLLAYLEREAGRFDTIVTHGVWTFPPLAVHGQLKRRVCRPLHINLPHGDLDPNFRTWFPAKHYLKKLPFYKIAGSKVLESCDGVLFTSLEERSLASIAFPSANPNRYVIRYGIERPPQTGEVLSEIRQLIENLRGRRKLLYFGRIHPKKGPDLLIQAFGRIAPGHPNLHLIMAGTGDAAVQASLKGQAEAMGVANRISWTGPVVGYSKWHLYRNSDAFILPSHTENFGITVAEAMSVRLPVLISNKVNIYPDIAASDAGLVETDTTDGTAALLNKWLAMPYEQCAAMGIRAEALVKDRFQAHQSAEDLVKICESLRAQRLKRASPAA
jgi:glycosyltransferase involved in cell wall biosynthesis